MAIYNYFCENCEEEMEISHSILEDKKTTCPKCKKESLKRMVSKGGTFYLKGGNCGWERDSYNQHNQR